MSPFSFTTFLIFPYMVKLYVIQQEILYKVYNGEGNLMLKNSNSWLCLTQEVSSSWNLVSDKRIELVSGFYLAWTLMAYIFLFLIALSSTTEDGFSKMCFLLSKVNFNNPIKSLKKYVHYLLWFYIQGTCAINVFYEWNFYVQVSPLFMLSKTVYTMLKYWLNFQNKCTKILWFN